MKIEDQRDLTDGKAYWLDTSRLGLDKGTIRVVVRGVATTGVPLAGRQVIVYAPLLWSEMYPYDFCVVSEMFLEAIE